MTKVPFITNGGKRTRLSYAGPNIGGCIASSVKCGKKPYLGLKGERREVMEQPERVSTETIVEHPDGESGVRSVLELPERKSTTPLQPLMVDDQTSVEELEKELERIFG